MPGFKEALQEQRWDDHRYYHHSIINQALHFVSATTFLIAYVVVWIDPAVASLLGWLVAMTARQSGHFFFEPKTYDHVNQATHEHKEEIKVGYNLFRKVVFMALWAAMPIPLLIDPTFLGIFEPHVGFVGFLRHLALLWLAFAVGGLLFRVIQLFVQRDVMTGIVWATKIVTDPFNDFILYRKAPVQLLKGARIDTDLQEEARH